MPVSKFKFVSPGVQIAEIDNSQLPRLPEPIGPVIIGRTSRGPGLRPVQVDSFSEFIEIFGNPQPGGGGSDVWRNGGAGLSPTYGAYAAQAWLRNSSPVTFVRLLGKQHPDNSTVASPNRAGWTAGTFSSTELTRAGGAYGMFVVPSGSGMTPTTANLTGTLGAIFYLTAGSMGLRGADQAGTEVSGAITVVKASGGAWKMEVRAGTGETVSETVTFDFVESSKNYIRKVFNTNPTLTNSTINSAGTKTYWLGETFDRNLADLNANQATQIGTGVGTTDFAILLPLKTDTGTAYNQGVQLRDATKAETPFIISQDLAGASGAFNYQKLFRFRTLEAGEWEMKNFKISIADVKASNDTSNPYGTFTVEVRLAKDSDNAKQVVERFSQCNLNPNSTNYIAKKIGDSYVVWSNTERRYRDYGNHPNQSKYIYVDMNAEVDDAATNETFLPFGFEGPIRWDSFRITSGSTVASTTATLVSGGAPDKQSVNLASSTERVDGKPYFGTSGSAFQIQTGSFLCQFPKFPLRLNSTQGNLASQTNAYFGLDTSKRGSTAFDYSYQDLVRPFGNYAITNVGNTSLAQSRSYIFTMEDLTYLSSSIDATGSTTVAGANRYLATSSTDVYYYSGSRAQGRSLSVTAAVGSSAVSASWNNVLKQGFDSFTVPLWGGFDGLNITEREPFRNTGLTDKTETNSYVFNSIKIAVDSCADPEVVECNLMSMPGLTHAGLTGHIIKTCEDRADALAVIDIANGYVPSAENSSAEQDRGGTISTAISTIENRELNSSYGCCYYPWVQARDTETGKSFWCPPSVAAIGTFSSAQRKSEVWFAPAGFTRGGLTEGAAGIPVVNVKQRLTSKQRDQLYEANINPIASFPAEGIVIFGQKTLQTTPSALDRVNVRRLMIHLKKEVSRIASRLLFDQNVQVTWDRFTGQVVPFLDSVKARLGLTDYRVILDETTTTPDLIDRNIMYAKIYLKPARAIEFIAIDFVITSTGASFED